MKFHNIKVGDEVGIRNENPSSIRYYKYERAKVLEINEESFRLNRGWFSKVDGRKGSNIVVPVSELEQNNANFYLELRANRLNDEIKCKLEGMGNELKDIELMENIVLLFNNYR